MAVEPVAYIRAVRNPFYDSIHFPELFHLQAAEALRRRSVDSVKISVFLLKLIYFVIDVLKNLQGKLAIFPDRFAIIQLLKLV